MSKSYDPHVIEPKWQRAWEETKLYQVDLDAAERPFYNLMEFPYPSGAGLHVGHFFNYSGADAYGRYQRMRGYDVFQPMGWDAFGINAENYALKIGQSPAQVVPRNVRRFRDEQIKRMGAAFDWKRELNTSAPDYYRWTQWIFIQLYKGGLAYRAKSPVNWCPSCLTTLANEQVVAGECERCHNPVEQRALTQWFLRITDYADRLLDYSGVDFSETTRRLQQHWIGRKEGAEITFVVQGSDETITVFTTRPDTLFGATFLVLAPEHPAVRAVSARGEAVEAYVEQAKRRSEMERMAGEREKSGVFSGACALNPVDGRPLPIYVADYVLMGFGTGAIFGTPAHDQRDWEFAQAHDLPIIPVVWDEGQRTVDEWEQAYEGDGVLVNSGPYDGLTVEEAKKAIVADLEARGLARPAVSYRLRDWLISRQRYWGPPIPIIYCEACGEAPVPEEDLPVLLPETEHYRPLGTGQSPLASIPGFVNTTCPRCGGPAQRETDVSDTFLDSAWYFMRFLNTEFGERPWDAGRLKRWLPVTTYIGGIEHSTMHHLYARFVWKALHDLGHLPPDVPDEPFARLRLHGMIVLSGAKMSKSRGNVVNPDGYVAQWGADVLRTYLLFTGPYEEGGVFHDEGIVGVSRFFNRLWTQVEVWGSGSVGERERGQVEARARRILHRTIKRVTEDIEALCFNTAIAALMEALNGLRALSLEGDVTREAARTMTLLVAPFAPHLAEELWERMGGAYSVHQQAWPQWDPAWIAQETITLVVQVNGKLRDRIQAPADIDDESAQALALSSEAVQRHLDGRPPRRVVVVPGKLVNVVV